MSPGPSEGENRDSGWGDEFHEDKAEQDAYRQEQYEQAAQDDPEHDLYIVSRHAYNLSNVAGVRREYPGQYAAQMRESVVKPPGFGPDRDDWVTYTFAWHRLGGILCADTVESITENWGEDRFGIPEEFFEIPRVKRNMRYMVNRPSIPPEVQRFLAEEFDIELDESATQPAEPSGSTSPEPLGGGWRERVAEALNRLRERRRQTADAAS